MGTVHRLPAGRQVTLGEAASGYLATLAGEEQRNTRRAYSGVLRRLGAEFGAESDVAGLDASALAAWFTATWAERAPATWNLSLNAIRSAAGYWRDQDWIAEDPTRLLRPRRVAPDRDRALSRDQVAELLARRDLPLRDKLLISMLYETAARASEILGLDVADLDMPNRRARIVRKGAIHDRVAWLTGTARLLSRYLRGRTTGPLFLTERRARVALPPGDIDPASGRARLSYRQAEDLFKAASGGATLHQLRHSALAHAAEGGASTPMLQSISGHASVRSLAKYARVSPDAMQRYRDETDPARRRR